MDQHARLDLIGALDGVSGPGVVEALRLGVVEVAPAVDVDDVAVGPRLAVVSDLVVTHRSSLQQRFAQGQNRHSWKSGDCATRGSSSPASGTQNAHRLVARGLGEAAVEGHELVMELGGVLVDGGKERRVPGDAR